MSSLFYWVATALKLFSRAGLTDGERVRMIASADRVAQAMGYKPETMNIVLAKVKDRCLIKGLFAGGCEI